jgi:hypothetical protein
MKLKKSSFFGISRTMLCKNIVKILNNNDMVEVQTWEL